jgi:GAF domain-containing protein
MNKPLAPDDDRNELRARIVGLDDRTLRKSYFPQLKKQIEELKTAQQRILRLSNLYAALSQCNQAIVRSTEQSDLFRAICRAAVQFGGVRMAWIGLVDGPDNRVVPVASFGDDTGFLERVAIKVDAADPFGRGPTGTAIREDRPIWFHQYQSNPDDIWYDAARVAGFGSSASLPLHRKGIPVGNLSLYAESVDMFDDDAQRLLIEMATDVSFALDNFAREAERKQALERIQQYVAQLERAFVPTVLVATNLSELRDPYTAGHERRVGRIAKAIAVELGLDDKTAEGLEVAGYLHDLGKITIPAEILARPGRLSEAEFMLIKGHSEASHSVLKQVEFPWPIAEIVLQHHERLDGSGYPRGLKGAEILPEARILAVADVVEAMASHRPYRPGLGLDRALAEIEQGSGRIYDPDVVRACLRLFREKGLTLP